MARIRVVDQWVRSPVAGSPTNQRVVMVVTEKWAEQRVLMRAYNEARDQTRPVIMLHGTEYAIGPAGLDANGPWGIHVTGASALDDGAAQQVSQQLEISARRLAGSKGNAPRLADEESTFEREPTGNWAPGTLRALASARDAEKLAAMKLVPPSPAPAATAIASSNAQTALGYQSGAGAQSALVRLGLRPELSARLSRFSTKTVPQDFQISQSERDVLNALGNDRPLSAVQIGQLISVTGPISWMDEFIAKLARYGLDLIESGPLSANHEPTYVLRT